MHDLPKAFRLVGVSGVARQGWSSPATRMALVAEPLQLAEPVISQVENLAPPLLHQIIELEDACFVPCERLGPFTMQQQALQRTSGLLLAEMCAAVRAFISAATALHSPRRHRVRASRRGSNLSGYLLFSRSATAGLITKLAVSVAFRRCGIGSALLRRGIQELERPARRSAPSEIQLHVDPANTSARSLYESFGFERVALLPKYYSDSRDALLMRRLTAATEAVRQC